MSSKNSSKNSTSTSSKNPKQLLYHSASTYETTKAALLEQRQADPIHWRDASAFRDTNYRQLHHQNGVIGVFSVRLLEASQLSRPYWSALALGPVKLLGLSKAHGAVSSYCTFSLQCHDPHDNDTDSTYYPDQKPVAKNNNKSLLFVSSVIHQDNNPVWTGNDDTCHFEFALPKGSVRDGQRIHLTVAVREEATAVDSFLPSLDYNSSDRFLLGIGTLDLTELCLGETVTGQPLPGVRDAWIDLSLPQQQQQQHSNNSSFGSSSKDSSRHHHHSSDTDLLSLSYNSNSYSKDDPLAPPPPASSSAPSSHSNNNNGSGKVRVLVSYKPVGMEPQANDVIALEAFARRNPHTSSCRPVLPPLEPLTVLERRGAYILAEYHHNHNDSCCVRLHRNAVFVIERQNLLDAAHKLALLPVDVALNTPVGRGVSQALTPVVQAGSELCMPAILSCKLIWMAARTTGLGVWSGVQALGCTLWHEGSSSLTGNRNNNNNNDSNNRRRNSQDPRRGGGGGGTAQFVQL